MDSSLKDIYPYISTRVDTKFLISELFESLEYAEGEYWLNIHDKRVETLLKLPRSVNITYTGDKNVTTLSYETYGTTSLWWLIVTCSGYTHAHEIPYNTDISVPEFLVIQSTFEKVYTGLRNKVIVI